MISVDDCGPNGTGKSGPRGEEIQGLPSWVNTMPNQNYEPLNVEPEEIPIESIDLADVRSFVAYWNALKGERFAAPWKRFDLMALDAESVPRVVVVDVLTDPVRFKYRFWGTANTNTKGIDMTGKSLDDFPLVRRTVAWAEYNRVVAERRSIAFKDKLVLPETSRTPLRFKAAFDQIMVRLPLSSDGKTVDHIVSLACWEKSPRD